MENHLDAVISKNLMKIRADRNYTQAQIADVLHIKQPSYNRMECGRTRVSAVQLWILAMFYHVSLIDFFLENQGTSDNSTDVLELSTELRGQIEELKEKSDNGYLPYNRMLAKLRELEEKMASRDEIIESLLNGRLRKVD